MMAVLLVGLGGALGAAARFVLDGELRARRRGPFPWGTFVVNVLGSLLVGVVAGLILFTGAAESLAPWRLAVATGLCGGFTTFSTAMVETIRLAGTGRVRLAVVSVVGTLLATVSATAVGAGAVALLS